MALSVLSFSSKTDSQSGNLSVFISVLVPSEKEMPATAGLVHGAHKDSSKYGEQEGRFAWNSRMSSTPLLRSGFWKGLNLSLENCPWESGGEILGKGKAVWVIKTLSKRSESGGCTQWYLEEHGTRKTGLLPLAFLLTELCPPEVVSCLLDLCLLS